MRKYFVAADPAGKHSSLPVLPYLYAKTQTVSGVGYFGCRLEHTLDLEYGLELLAARPLDSYLHCQLLETFGNMESSRLVQWAMGARGPLIKYLLLECAYFFPQARLALEKFLPSLSRLDDSPCEYTPLPHLLLAKTEDLRKNLEIGNFFRENIQNHRLHDRDQKLSHTVESGLIWEELQEKKGILASLYSSMTVFPPENPVSANDTYHRAYMALEKAGLLEFPEMRHEASLSPIALLREWPVRISIESNKVSHTLTGKSTAYGRGLSLAQARASCLMELAERASAHAGARCDDKGGEIAGSAKPISLFRYTLRQLRNTRIYAPVTAQRAASFDDAPFYWMTAEDPHGNSAFVPAQSVFLFLNLDEPTYFESGGSTGLGAGNTIADARLSALVEIIERDAHATTPFFWEGCFLLRSRDSAIQGLLEDYRSRGIFPIFQDITTEIGVPSYRCFVISPQGEIIQATGAGLDGKKACLAALTETPWPYSWATPGGAPTRLPDRMLPLITLEDLPNFDLGGARANLLLLENTLQGHGLTPLYADISRADLQIPVVRAFVPGLQTHADFDEIELPSQRLLARWHHCRLNSIS